MTVNIQAMSRYSEPAKRDEDNIKTISTSYATTLPLDFTRKDAIMICRHIIFQEFKEEYESPSKYAGKRIATLDGITESFSQNQYCFCVSGDVHLVENKDFEIDF